MTKENPKNEERFIALVVRTGEEIKPELAIGGIEIDQVAKRKKDGATVWREIKSVDPTYFGTEGDMKRWLEKHIKGKVEKSKEAILHGSLKEKTLNIKLEKPKVLEFSMPKESASEKTPDGRLFGEVMKEYISKLKKKYDLPFEIDKTFD